MVWHRPRATIRSAPSRILAKYDAIEAFVPYFRIFAHSCIHDLGTCSRLPRSTLRAGLYRQRTMSAENLAAIWHVLEAAGVRRLPPDRGQGGVGVRLMSA